MAVPAGVGRRPPAQVARAGDPGDVRVGVRRLIASSGADIIVISSTIASPAASSTAPAPAGADGPIHRSIAGSTEDISRTRNALPRNIGTGESAVIRDSAGVSASEMPGAVARLAR